ncbi:expressed unknown protein [Seminavis robusta]|uniref:Secreted protein n=1 Tax=Seminavis robusta TaxID=568900 RepID=A0A9N8E9U2_9STRA|nr:expressed unknown protein [Seminavis robusta]|eukprot:Sro857_g211700.1 n/a (130) ;mRNA; f:23790-24179
MTWRLLATCTGITLFRSTTSQSVRHSTDCVEPRMEQKWSTYKRVLQVRCKQAPPQDIANMPGDWSSSGQVTRELLNSKFSQRDEHSTGWSASDRAHPTEVDQNAPMCNAESTSMVHETYREATMATSSA